jgi:hypothetical protein
VVDTDQDDFGSVGADFPKKTATIYIVRGRESSPAAKRTLEAVRVIVSAPAGPSAMNNAPTWTLFTATVKHSLRELNGPMDQTNPPEPWRSASKGSLNAWYVDPNKNAVIMGVTKVTPALQSAARATYGDLVIVLAAPQVFPAGQTGTSG